MIRTMTDQQLESAIKNKRQELIYAYDRLSDAKELVHDLSREMDELMFEKGAREFERAMA